MDPEYGRPAAGRSGSSGAEVAHAHIETKPFYRTSEFWVLAVIGVLLLLAGSLVQGDEDAGDHFAADKVWLYVTILGAAYVISRGLAKSGVREPHQMASGGHGHAGMPLGERVKTAARVLAEGETPRQGDDQTPTASQAPTSRL